MKSAIASLGICLFLPAAVSAAEEVSLKPTTTPGREVVVDVETSVKQKLKLAGMDLNTEVVATETRALKYREESASGEATLEATTPKMQFNLNAPGGISIAFYSDTPDQKAANPQMQDLIDFLKIVSKARTTIELDADGKVDKVKMEAEDLDSAPELFKSHLTPESLKRTLAAEFNRTPDKPVAAGDTWTRSDIFDAGQGQLFSFTTSYKYEGREQKDGKSLDKVTATYDGVKFEIGAGSVLPLQVKSSDLEIAESTAEYWFDPERKLIASSESQLKITGEIEFVANGQDLPAELDLTIVAKSNVKSVKDPE